MRVLRPTLIVGLSLAVSRVLGFARDVLIAAALGAGPVADAFLIALRLPNLARRALGDGGLNVGVVPAYVRAERLRGEAGARAFAGDAIAIFAIGLAAAVALLELAAPLVVLALAPAYLGEPEQWHLASEYLRLVAPFVGVTALASLVGAVLNAERRFVAAAIAPAAVNGLVVALAAVVAWVAPPPAAAGRWLATALSFAGFCQLVIVMAALRANGWPKWRRPRLSKDIRNLLGNAVPALAAAALPQLILIVATIVASASPSAVSWLYYADRLFQLPLSLVGVAMAIVLLPEIARGGGGRAALNVSLEAGFALALPAAAALAALAHLVVTVLFERGAFSSEDGIMTALALIGLAPGLPAAMAGRVLSQDFFARATSRAPALAGLAALATTLASAGLLAGPFGIAGIAAGASLGFWVHAVALGVVLVRSGRWQPDRRALARTLKLLAASAVMAAALLGLVRVLPATAAGLAAHCFVGLAVYGLAALAMRAVTMVEIGDALRGR